MILVTNLNGNKFYLNPGLIEIIEEVPDTLITMANGRKYCVLETPGAVTEQIEAYRARILNKSGDPAYLRGDGFWKDPDELEE